MGKYLIWIMCLMGYEHVLAQFELSTPWNVFFTLIALIAFILWCEEK